ncbi:FAD-binding oxidoreductase [Psychrobacillus sp. PGGUH221]|uniref:FAD-binding protein n=1 Tax=Psychrobacillus sp. PGGUH221 TaxID=3020058 RepID=UPI0035C7850E
MYKRQYFVIFYILLLVCSLILFQAKLAEPVVKDHGRLLPVKMKAIKSSDREENIVNIIEEANEKDIPISIAGMQHSQGGQTLYPDGILLDMKSYNKILDLDTKNKLITVQSGVTWADIQSYINPYGLALKVSQSQNIFTVGGSLSVNVHGRDIQYTSLIETVESFRLLTSQGKIIQVSREENTELFQLVNGGYGLFGVILDVTLQLTDDKLYKVQSKSLTYDEYSTYFTTHVKGDSVKMHLARISVAPDSFLSEMYVTNYYLAEDQSLLSNHTTLKRERIIAIPKLLLGLSRINTHGKNMFWKTQKEYNNRIDGSYISRNNVMRSESTFMEYDSASKTELLQEYFVPLDEFTSYIDDLREMLQKEKNINLLNITIRYVKQNDEAIMSYAKEDMFALVLLINQETNEESIEEVDKVIQKMIDITLEHDGTYYLPYYNFPTKSQLEIAYPRAKEFFELKEKYDPEKRFLNLFYEEYYK